MKQMTMLHLLLLAQQRIQESDELAVAKKEIEELQAQMAELQKDKMSVDQQLQEALEGLIKITRGTVNCFLWTNALFSVMTLEVVIY